ncbi:MAG: UMP kinase [bacterium]|nr:UMP kinase [bacterium]
MSNVNSQMYVVSLGGSLIVPHSGIDWQYLKKFRATIVKQIKKGKKFIIVAGGGVTARQYAQAAQKVLAIKSEDRDWLGIHSSRLNAHLVRTIFYDWSHPEIIRHADKKIKFKEKIIVAGGWKPGWSTDYVAVRLADAYGVNKVINLSNIDYVYTKDPKKFKDAKKIEKINWPDFRKIVGDKWTPGMSKPFDPIASKLAEKLKLKVVIMNGKKLGNLDNLFKNNKCNGTVISSTY